MVKQHCESTSDIHVHTVETLVASRIKIAQNVSPACQCGWCNLCIVFDWFLFNSQVLQLLWVCMRFFANYPGRFIEEERKQIKRKKKKFKPSLLKTEVLLFISVPVTLQMFSCIWRRTSGPSGYQSAGQITRRIPLIAPREAGLRSSVLAIGRHRAPVLWRFIPCYPPITFT